jgi:hypothetical protein
MHYFSMKSANLGQLKYLTNLNYKKKLNSVILHNQYHLEFCIILIPRMVSQNRIKTYLHQNCVAIRNQNTNILSP